MSLTVKDELLVDLSEDILENISDEDYIVVLGKNGKIKTIIAPADDEEMSDEVKEALGYFGIYNLDGYTIH